MILIKHFISIVVIILSNYKLALLIDGSVDAWRQPSRKNLAFSST